MDVMVGCAYLMIQRCSKYCLLLSSKPWQLQYESKKISAPEIVNVMYTIQNYDLVGEVAIVFYTSV